MPIKLCFCTINGSPDFLGGYSLYHKNLIKYIKQKGIDLDISWVYFGDENKEYNKDGVHYFEIKSKNINPLVEIKRHLKLAKFFNEHYFDILNCNGGLWTRFYKKKEGQKIIHTYHGTIYYFNKNQLSRFGFLKITLFSLILPLSKTLDKPHKDVDKIICVSDKVKRQVESLYGKKYNFSVIRTGVDLNDFRIKSKCGSKLKLGLREDLKYGLYIGGGGYWGKGLDRAIKISEEIYSKNKDYRLIVIGADYNKIKSLINNLEYVIYLDDVPREKIPYYYSSSEMFFSVSRYEGGAPTMVTSEAMASGCFIIFSRDSEQEIIDDGVNGIIFEKFDKDDFKRLIDILNNPEEYYKIIKNSVNTISKLSLDKWGEEIIKEFSITETFK